MKNLIIPVLVLILAAGCSSNMSKEELVVYTKAQETLSKELDKPTLQISCGESGCSGLSMTYNDPSKIKSARVVIPKRTNGYDVLNNVVKGTVGIVTTATPWVAVGAIGVEGIKAAGGNNSHNSNVGAVDNSVVDNSATATPTVVNTPDPVVVIAPDPIVVDPVVVNAPDPIIVPVNDPLIVDPVIVDPVIVSP